MSSILLGSPNTSQPPAADAKKKSVALEKNKRKLSPTSCSPPLPVPSPPHAGRAASARPPLLTTRRRSEGRRADRQILLILLPLVPIHRRRLGWCGADGRTEIRAPPALLRRPYVGSRSVPSPPPPRPGSPAAQRPAAAAAWSVAYSLAAACFPGLGFFLRWI